MATISNFPPSGMQRVKQYLADRAINTEPEYMALNQLECVGPARIDELLGYSIGAETVGLCIHFPDTEYFQLRPVGHQKYKILCPAGLPPHAYRPASIDWPSVSGRLIITESALKALTWADFGFNAMAAGGVSTVYMARKKAWCEGFPHAAIERGAITEVWVSFDSDIDANHDVARSMRQLIFALGELYPKLPVKIKILPDPERLGVDRPHWGVDDFRKHLGDDEFLGWCQDEGDSLREPEENEQKIHFDALDAQYIYCRNPVSIIEIRTGEEYSTTDFCNVHEAGRLITIEDRTVGAAKRWMCRPRDERPEVRQKAYHPGQDVLVEGDYNDWRPSDLEPREGDVQPWLDMLEESITCDKSRELLIQCMAFQVQRRGERLPKIIYLTGYKQGTGKSTQCEIMQAIMGHDNTAWITRSEIESNFNSDWTTKELVVLDDCPKMSKDLWPRIKNHVTSDVVTVQRKFKEGRQQKNYAVLYVSANTADVLPIEFDERRVLMIEFDPKKLHREEDDTYWSNFHQWLNHGGIEAIAYYLQKVVNLQKFDPNFHPPNSEVKMSASMMALTDEEQWLNDFHQNFQVYVPKGRTIITPKEMWILYSGEDHNQFNDKQYKRFSRLLTKTRLFPNARGPMKQVTLPNRTRVTALCLPGHVTTKDPGSGPLLDNIKDYPITLNNGCEKM